MVRQVLTQPFAGLRIGHRMRSDSAHIREFGAWSSNQVELNVDQILAVDANVLGRGKGVEGCRYATLN